jgi:hypothetical protein
MPFPGRNALWPTLGAALIIAAGRGAWVNRVILSNKIMVWIGLISYPLYLWHWPLLSLARIVEQETPSREIRLAAVALSFVLAALTYYALEKPLRRISPKGTVAAALCVLLALTAALGWNVYKREGYGFRDAADLSKPTLSYKDDNNNHTDIVHLNKPFGDPNHRSFYYRNRVTNEAHATLLLGDSHAGSLGVTMAKAFNTSPLTVFYTRMSPPLLNIRVTQRLLHTEDFYDYRFNPETYNDTQTIILSGYWAVYGQIGIDNPSDISNTTFTMIYDGKDYPAGDFSWFEPALRATLTHLTSMGKTVILTHDVPELPFQPKECMDNRPFRLTNKHAKDCTQTKEAAMARQHVARTIFPKVLADFPQVKLFDPIDTFCPTDRCMWADTANKTTYYFDINHLSHEGAQLYAKAFKAKFPELFAE